MSRTRTETRIGEIEMKRCLSLALGLVLSLGLSGTLAAQDDQKDLIDKRDKKLQSEFLKKAPWITDYDKALEEAQKSNKLIMGYFTRSYAP